MATLRLFSSAQLKSALKAVFTLLLFVSVIFILTKEYRRLLNYHQVSQLNKIIPANYAVLINNLEQGKKVQVDELIPYVKFYRLVVRYFPDSAEAYSLLAFCFYHLGDQEEALQFYQKAYQLNQTYFIFPYNLAVIYYQRNQFDLSEKYLRSALSININDTLNLLLQSTKLFGLIISSENMSLDLIKTRVLGVYRRGYELLVLLYYQKKEYPKMMEAAAQATSRNFDDNGQFSYYSGLAYFFSGNFMEAKIFFEQALQRNNQLIPAYRYLGHTLEKLGNKELSSQILNQTRPYQHFDDSPVVQSSIQDIRIF